MDIQPLGDVAIRICFGEGINETIHKQVQYFTSKLHFTKINGIVDCVPAYHTVAIYYRPEIISYKKLVDTVERIYYTSAEGEPRQPLVYEVPVYYGGNTGQDLSFIAQY